MNKPPHILVVTGWSWKDPLIQVYTLPYVRAMLQVLPAGTRIRLATMEQPAQQVSREEKETITKELDKEGISWIALPYRPFGFGGAFTWMQNLARLARIVLSKQITVVHAWCMPAGALGWLLAALGGCRLVIDSYEPHAEAMVENGTWKKNSMRFRLLFLFERLLTKKADAFIAVTEGMKDYAREKYGMVPSPMFIKPALVDLAYYSSFPRKEPTLLSRLGMEEKIVGLYAGKFGGIYLTREVFDFFKAASDHWGTKFRILLLTGHNEEELQSWAKEAGLDWNYVMRMKVPPSDMPLYLGLADFALTPVKPVPTKRYCTPIKDGEYWAAGLPVVITHDISDDSGLIKTNDAGYVLDSLDRKAYDAAVQKLDMLIAADQIGKTREAAFSLARRYRDLAQAPGLYQRVYAMLFQGQEHLPR